MQHLRRQVDRIDLKILKLLQQRTKLSAEIGHAKRLHGAAIYVPERERDLLTRLLLRSRGKPPAGALAAIYREILSSSRAAQGQPEIGLLRTSAPLILLPAHSYFGSCDLFSPKKTWIDLAKGVESGSLALILLTGDDLAQVMARAASRQSFFEHFTVVGDFPSSLQPRLPLARRIFVVMPKGKGASLEANRGLILIKCKSIENAVKSLLAAMPDRSLHAETLALVTKPSHDGTVEGLVRLPLPRPIDGIRATSQLLSARQASGISLSILGVYSSTEAYAG